MKNLSNIYNSYARVEEPTMQTPTISDSDDIRWANFLIALERFIKDRIQDHGMRFDTTKRWSEDLSRFEDRTNCVGAIVALAFRAMAGLPFPQVEYKKVPCVNLNDRVEVRLTERGKEVYLKDATEHGYAHLAGKRDFSKPYRAELHSLMQIFGPSIYLGGPTPFVDNLVTVESDGGPLADRCAALQSALRDLLKTFWPSDIRAGNAVSSISRDHFQKLEALVK